MKKIFELMSKSDSSPPDIGQLALININDLERRADAGEENLFDAWIFWKSIYDEQVFLLGDETLITGQSN